MKRRWAERGDTLVEVTIALAILAAVIAGAYVAAIQALNVGQAANERGRLNAYAQEQMDALRSFRDAHSWSQFVCGASVSYCQPSQTLNTCNSSQANVYCGIEVRKVNGITAGDPSADCNVTADPFGQAQLCFHMEQKVIGGVREWVPVRGDLIVSDPSTYNVGVAGTDRYVNITLPVFYNNQDPLKHGDNALTFSIYYGTANQGDFGTGVSRGRSILTLANIDNLRSN